MAAISTLLLGIALVSQGGAIASRWRTSWQRLDGVRYDRTELINGIGTEVFGGCGHRARDPGARRGRAARADPGRRHRVRRRAAARRRGAARARDTSRPDATRVRAGTSKPRRRHGDRRHRRGRARHPRAPRRRPDLRAHADRAALRRLLARVRRRALAAAAQSSAPEPHREYNAARDRARPRDRRRRPAGLSTALHLQAAAPADCASSCSRRRRYPREKICAGGIGARAFRILEKLGVAVDCPMVPIDAIALRFGGERSSSAIRTSASVVRRVEFDHALAQGRDARGIDVRDGTPVAAIDARRRRRARHDRAPASRFARARSSAPTASPASCAASSASRAASCAPRSSSSTPRPSRTIARATRSCSTSPRATSAATRGTSRRSSAASRWCAAAPTSSTTSAPTRRRHAHRAYLAERGLDVSRYRLKQFAERGFEPGRRDLAPARPARRRGRRHRHRHRRRHRPGDRVRHARRPVPRARARPGRPRLLRLAQPRRQPPPRQAAARSATRAIACSTASAARRSSACCRGCPR